MVIYFLNSNYYKNIITYLKKIAGAIYNLFPFSRALFTFVRTMFKV